MFYALFVAISENFAEILLCLFTGSVQPFGKRRNLFLFCFEGVRLFLPYPYLAAVCVLRRSLSIDILLFQFLVEIECVYEFYQGAPPYVDILLSRALFYDCYYIDNNP